MRPSGGRQGARGPLDLLLQLGHQPPETFLLLLRQPLEIVGLDHLAVTEGGQPDALSGSDEGDPLLPRPGLDLGEGLGTRLVELGIEELPAPGVVVALEDRGDRRLQLLEKALHVLPGGRAPGWPAPSARAAGERP